MSARVRPGRTSARRRDPALPGRLALAAAAALVAWAACASIGLVPWRLVDARSLDATARFLAGFVPPAHDPAFLARTLRAAWTTVAIATSGLVLALALGVPLALLGTARLSVSAVGRPMSGVGVAVRATARGVALVLRGVPELVWALLFVRVTGLGHGAGTLAVGLTGAGLIAKVHAEILESAPRAPVEALLANGAGRLRSLLVGALPQCADELVSYTVYRWECAVRASAVLGFVGAGGLGQEIELSVRGFAGAEVATLLLALVALVVGADRLSRSLRTSAGGAAGGAPGRRATGARAGRAAAVALGVAVASVVHVDWGLARFADPAALARLGDFLAGLWPPLADAATLRALGDAMLETLAMSALGTAGAVPFALGLARSATGGRGGASGLAGARRTARAAARALARTALVVQRAVPELVWATLLIVAVGLGPVTGTLALCAHTVGTLGRLFAETLENADAGERGEGDGAAAALRANGASAWRAFAWGTLPSAGARLASHALYRWEANIRAAAVLGVVGAGGLGQRLHVELSLFRLDAAAATVLATLVLVAAVDLASHALRRRLAG